MARAEAVPVTLVTGDEELLVDRAVGDVVTAARAVDPEVEIHDLTAAQVAPGALAELTSPSLFGGGRVVVIRSAQDLSKRVAAEVGMYAASPADDIALVVVHAGGAKGKALLTALSEAGVPRVTCSKITRPGERIDFVRAEVRRTGRAVTEDAARTLVDAIGTDLRELAAACSQLVVDVTGPIDVAAVARYYRGRAEVSGFNVADRAIEGRLANALEQLRWALATGVSPVLITSALAQGLRSLAKVGSARRGLRGPALAKELAMPNWKIDRVRQQLRGWTPQGVAHALSVVAETDAQVKGGGADPAYALERAIGKIVAARSAH